MLSEGEKLTRGEYQTALPSIAYRQCEEPFYEALPVDCADHKAQLKYQAKPMVGWAKLLLAAPP